MTATTTTPSASAGTPPRARRRPAAGRALLARSIALLALAVAVTAVLIGPAGAQSATTVAPTTTLPAENPGSTGAGIVFFGVTGVIILGALILYLRNRRPKVASPEG